MHTIGELSKINHGTALIIGVTNDAISALASVLKKYFNQIDIIPDLVRRPYGSGVAPPSAIVVTDLAACALNKYFFEALRTIYPSAWLLCLVENINPETEKRMRSAGLLYLGSYDHFSSYHDSILRKAISATDRFKLRS